MIMNALADHNLKRITKADEEFSDKFDFNEIKFSVKIRDINKIEKDNADAINVFGYENKAKHPIYASKECCKEKHFGLLLTREEGIRNYNQRF